LAFKVLQMSFGDGYAGSATMAILSSVALGKTGYNVSLFVSENSLTEKRGKDRGLNTVSFDSRSSNKNLFNEVENYYKDFKPDFVISYHSLDRKLAIRLRQKHKKDFINIAYRQNMSKSFPVIGQWIYNNYFDYQLACSYGVAEDLIKAGAKKSKVKVIHNVTEYPENIDSISGKSIREKLGLNDKTVLGISSWFHKERKGFDILFDAFSKTKDNFVLLIIGIPKPNQDEVYEYAESFEIKKERIVMPGFVDNIYEYYKAMDIFLLPSRSEGFSLALLEAAFAKLPVIASNIPGNNEIIFNGKTGLLFELNNPGELLNKILEMSDNPDKAKEMAANVNKEVMNNFTLNSYSEKLNEFLKGIISDREL
jgi:glycosyltransferase involved in cell wall biosynthesis